ncbi:MAG: ABC transporter ATP-binding protein [Caldilineales bacterium]|nr:ABC transporter ATP-binding protein [Caldilineales bacterium]
MSIPPPAIEMLDITKRFPGVVANDRVSLSVRKGEIHALLGENGAGKTTLMNVLYGLYRPDAGQIAIHGRPVEISGPRAAIDLGIGMVHQHFMLVPVLSVAENVILGLHGQASLLDLAATSRRLSKLAAQTGLSVDPAAKVWQLPVGVQQRVEILKFLFRGADILILDEPTAVLTPDETARFFAVLRQLQTRGVTIVLITHKLKEVMAISDRVTVMRGGRQVTTLDTKGTTPARLAQLMVGRDVLLEVAKRPAMAERRPVLAMHDLHARNERGLMALRGVSLTVHSGEILGLAGVSGNGQEELADVLAGVRSIEAGALHLHGQARPWTHPRAVLAQGVVQVPADRLADGAVADFTIAENAVLPTHNRRPFSRRGILNWPRIREFGRRLIEEYDIRGARPDSMAGWLSGGNLQKLILARQITLDPDVLVAVQPTRGLDVGATEFVHRKLIETRDAGKAILLISTDLDEILSLSDRIAVIYEGRINGELLPPFDLDRLGLLLAGDEA